MCKCTPSKRQVWCIDCEKIGFKNPAQEQLKPTQFKLESVRKQDWDDFALTVGRHIENYTVPQYGDKGDDLVSGYSSDSCVKQIEKYSKRFGKNVRDGQDKMDLLKIAHYAQMAYDLLETEVK